MEIILIFDSNEGQVLYSSIKFFDGLLAESWHFPAAP